MRKAIVLLLATTLLVTSSLSLLAQDQATPEDLLGSFEGALVYGRDDMKLALTFGKQDGKYSAALTSAEMGLYSLPAPVVEVDGLKIVVRIPRLDAEYTGTLRLDESGEKVLRIDGDWFQYAELVPVVLHPVDAPSF